MLDDTRVGNINHCEAARFQMPGSNMSFTWRIPPSFLKGRKRLFFRIQLSLKNSIFQVFKHSSLSCFILFSMVFHLMCNVSGWPGELPHFSAGGHVPSHPESCHCGVPWRQLRHDLSINNEKGRSSMILFYLWLSIWFMCFFSCCVFFFKYCFGLWCSMIFDNDEIHPWIRGWSWSHLLKMWN